MNPKIEYSMTENKWNFTISFHLYNLDKDDLNKWILFLRVMRGQAELLNWLRIYISFKNVKCEKVRKYVSI